MRIDPILAQNAAKIIANTDSLQNNRVVPEGSASFQSIFEEKLNESGKLIFSKHAQQRMAQRDITLSDADLEKLGSAIDKAGKKGVRDTLVFMNQTAFIVSVPNKTVVTVLKGQELENNVFSQIDGAVIL